MKITPKKAEKIVKEIPVRIKILARKFANTTDSAESNKIVEEINELRRIKEELNSFLDYVFSQELKRDTQELEGVIKYLSGK